VANEKREITVDFLARDKSGPATAAFSKGIKDVGDAATKADDKLDKFSSTTVIAGKAADDLGDESEQAAKRMSRLDREIALTTAELKVLAAQFADTSDKAARMDISKQINKSTADLRKLNKSKGLLEEILPDPDPSQIKKWTGNLQKMIGDGLAEAGPVMIGAGVAAVALAPTLGAAVAGAVVGGIGLGGIVGGVALAAQDPAINAQASKIGSTFLQTIQASAKDAFLGPVASSLDKLGSFAERSADKIGQIFDNTAPSLGRLTDHIIGAGDALLGSFVNASGKSAPVLDALGGAVENVSGHLSQFINMAADHADEGASAINDLADALGHVIDVTTDVVDALADIKGGLDSLDSGIDSARYKLEDHVGWLDLTADGYKKGSAAAELYRQGLIGVAGSYNDYDHYLQGATEATSKFRPAIMNTTQAVNAQREALSDLSKELQAESDPVFGLMDAEDQLADAQKASTQAIKEHGKGSREADAALRKLAEAALNLEGKAGALGATFNGQLTPKMRATLEAAGLTEGQINRLAKQFQAAKRDGDSFAKTYKANLSVDTGTAAARIDHVRSLLAQVRSKKISVSVLVADSQLDKVNNTLNRLGGARAKGGPVTKNVPYWVGENGPELMVPEANGRVMSAAASRGATAAGPSSSRAIAGGGTTRVQLELVGQSEFVSAFRYLVRTANILQDN
jgi:ABC-type transporter Mla subunit MlaD